MRAFRFDELGVVVTGAAQHRQIQHRSPFLSNVVGTRRSSFPVCVSVVPALFGVIKVD